MKNISRISLVIIAAAAMAMAQLPQGGQAGVDTLGGHLLNGRGCAGCHVPHSGPAGNGLGSGADGSTGDWALWGGNAAPLYGASLAFGDAGGYVTVLPTTTVGETDPRVGGLLMCLSCHDGNVTTGAMMKNKVWETLPAGLYGPNPIPTLLGGTGGNNGAAVKGDYTNDHPVGENAVVSCGPIGHTWDCVDTAGKIAMTGPYSSVFSANYGWTVSPAAYNGKAIVLCTTCHNQHVMTVYNGTIGNTKAFYTTYFGVKGAYNPTTGGNNTAQFCRQCHANHANETNGVMNIPTT